MPMKTTIKSGALDILAGFAALGLLFAYMLVYSRNDLQLFALVTTVLYFFAGLLRGASAPKNPWFKGLLIAFGGAIPSVAMKLLRMAMTEQGYVPVFIVSSVLLAVVGAETRRLISRGRRGAACLLALLCFGAEALLMATAIPSLMARWSSEKVNREAPSFAFVMLGGKPVASADLRGRVVVLAFWATWCLPCRQELPELQKVYEQYEGNSNVAFYAVGGPWGDDTADKESAFAKRIGLNMPLAFDSDGTAPALGVSTFPALIILDGGGRIRMVHSGYDASEHLAQHVSEEVGALAGN